MNAWVFTIFAATHTLRQRPSPIYVLLGLIMDFLDLAYCFYIWQLNLVLFYLTLT